MNLKRLLCGILVTAVSFGMLGLQPANAALTTQYSAHQVFEGVFFGEGPAASRIPEVWNNDVRTMLHIADIHNTTKFHSAIVHVESGISTIDPGYFASFASAMSSGDPGIVAQEFSRTQKDLEAYAHQQKIDIVKTAHKLGLNIRPKVVGDKININENIQINENVSVATKGIVVLVAAAAVVAAFVVIVWAAVAAVPRQELTATSDFSSSRTIALIASRFAGATRIGSVSR